MAAASDSPVLLQFPLPGEWMATRTPATGPLTHGTELLGQRYAYDFIRPTGRLLSPFGANIYLHAFAAVPATHFAAWDAEVVAAEGGRVIAAADGWPDRPWLNAWSELFRLRVIHRWRPVRLTADDWRPLAGNYVLVEGPSGVALYAHLRRDQLAVRRGDRIKSGDPIGRVGNSGRSSMPHLHFHLMDRAALDARGILCGFRQFDEWRGGRWQAASGLPGRRVRIRT